MWKFTEKMPDANSGHGILREPAQSKHMDISQEPFCVEIYKELAGHGWYHLD